jgi:iron complex transport system permease protein
MMSNKKYVLWGVLPLLVWLSFMLNLSIGSVSIPLRAMLDAWLQTNEAIDTFTTILWNIRLPKAITAVVAGAGLALSGLIMQTFFRNPLAGPYVLGISSGAGLGVAILLLAGNLIGQGFLFLTLSPWMQVAFGAVGSFMVFSLVIFASIRVKDSATLLIIGLMVASFSSAIISVLQYFSQAEMIQAFLFWSFGSLRSTTWDHLRVLIPIVLFGVVLTFMISKQLNAYLLGENYAQSMGLNIKKNRYIIMGLACLMAGSITAFCGPIAFVGLAVPHLVRGIFKTQNHRILIPGVVAVGAFVLLICDIVCQLPGANLSLPLNAVTSLIGAPVVIWILIRNRRLAA